MIKKQRLFEDMMLKLITILTFLLIIFFLLLSNCTMAGTEEGLVGTWEGKCKILIDNPNAPVSVYGITLSDDNVGNVTLTYNQNDTGKLKLDFKDKPVSVSGTFIVTKSYNGYITFKFNGDISNLFDSGTYYYSLSYSNTYIPNTYIPNKITQEFAIDAISLSGTTQIVWFYLYKD